MKGDRLCGIEELRRAVDAFSYQSEDFNMAFSAEELIAIWRAWKACEWDIYPVRWSPLQLKEAIYDGIVPTFEQDANGNMRATYRGRDY